MKARTGHRTPVADTPRWVPYHDHTNASVFPSGVGFNHNAAHHYNANNNWYPYQVCSTCYNRIDGLPADAARGERRGGNREAREHRVAITGDGRNLNDSPWDREGADAAVAATRQWPQIWRARRS